MRLSIISIIPIELYTTKRRDLCEQIFAKNQYSIGNEAQIFTEISGSSSSLYKISESITIAFHNSGLCFCVQKDADNWKLDHQSISNELKKRNEYHNSIIQNKVSNPIYGLLNNINKILPMETYEKAAPSYVFSFYVLEKNKNDSINKQELMKLVEPSIIDMDDMLSSKFDSNAEAQIKQSAINDIIDIDISNKSEIYMSWATIVSVVNGESYDKTLNLLSALEMRLQIVWNQCYSISQYVENVFDNKINITNISELFWSFSKTLDDAKSVLSSTYSSRADKIFQEMLKTSKIKGEILRLEQKVILLEKFIEQKNIIQSKKYQKTIELLLFITALASLAQIFFPIPISVFSQNTGFAIMFLVAILGFFAIFKSK